MILVETKIDTYVKTPKSFKYQRDFILRLQSLIHQEVKGEIYKLMIRQAWRSGGYKTEIEDEKFERVVQTQFKVTKTCEQSECEE